MVQLRARKARTSYAIQFPDIGDEEDQPQSSSSGGDDGPGHGAASTSRQQPQKRPKRRAPSRAESDASGSNFSADSKNKPASEESDEVSDAAVDERLLSDADRSNERRNDLDDDDESVLEGGSSRPGQVVRSAVRGIDQTKIGALAGRHERSGPLPHLVSKDVTGRPTPLYTPPDDSFNKRRLLREPNLFGDDPNAAGLYGTYAEQSKDRTSRKWSQVVSPGPAWELLEDVSWHKELFKSEISPATPTQQDAMDVDTKGNSQSPRPLVYHSVRVNPERIELLNTKDAEPFLPSDTASKSLPPPVPCHFGPFGSQIRVEVDCMSSYALSEYLEDSRAHVFNVGAPVWGLDWCPIEESNIKHRKGKQYLAVGPSTSKDFSPPIGSRLSRPAPACIQIWSMGPSPDDEGEAVMRCEMVLCVDCGPAQSLKWCPLPSHDADASSTNAEAFSRPPRKLGILGGVFADGSITFWAVPDPEDLHHLVQKSSASEQEYRDGYDAIKVGLKKPLLRIEMDDVPFWSLDWANSEMIAAATTNGIISVYHIKDHFMGKATECILPTYFRRVHQSAIRSLAWMKLPPSNGSGRFCFSQDPTIICSVGYDGQVLFVDVRDEIVNEMARYRDVINSVVFAPWTGGPVWTESEIIKWGSIGPTEIGRGHLTMQTVGSVWSLAVSDYHPFLAVASADGSCQTTNILKVMRQRFNGARVFYKIFQMDYNGNTGEYRMLENFLPIQLSGTRNTLVTNDPSEPSKPKPKKRAKGSAKEPVAPATSHTTAGWPPEVSVNVVSWNSGNGLTKARLLASGMASGLVRVEEMTGWVRDGVLSDVEEPESDGDEEDGEA
ncbi:hypothetical protein FRB98_001296 [Tulasnella sp. 332]|nr:hypothetical protein FRB98_001296 [Tulasnella sp. 332]